jgi:diguanylate cyclase
MNEGSVATMSGADEAKRQAQEWAALIQRLVKALEASHAGITHARKREGLARALLVRDPTAEALRSKLQRLVESWGQVNAGVDIGDLRATLETAESEATDKNASSQSGVAHTVSGLTQRIMSLTQPAIQQNSSSSGSITERLKAGIQKVETSLGRHQTLEPGVVEKMRNLLLLLLENAAQLTPESPLLAQQIDQLGHTLTMPLTVRRLEEAERQLRSLMIKQGAIKHSIEVAKNATKEMLAVLIKRIGRIGDSTGKYGEKIDGYAERIRRAKDLPELSDMVRLLLDDTRVITADMVQARDDMVESSQRLKEQEERVVLLERELERVSALVKTDPLTETLNRRGFEEAYGVEVARADRATQNCISIALLDVDNFKQLNDQLGHEAGDQALKHLASVLKDVLRPTDAVGRYGGEEFALLLPGLGVQQAAEVMVRMQRELTKRIFLHDNQKTLITFSAGVAQVDMTLGLTEALRRCDASMYEAKRTGKNRVLIAPMPVTA